MTITEDIRDRIESRLKDSELKSVLSSELGQLLGERPPDVDEKEYCSTIAFMLVREIGCNTLKKAANSDSNNANSHDPLDFDTILNGLLAAAQYDLIGSNIQMVRALGSAVAIRDHGTSEHSQRVTLIAVELGKAIGLSKKELQTLVKGAFLHDIGKIGIPDSALLKAGKFTDDEYTVMKNHPVSGSEIIDGVLWLDDAKEIILQHHEMWNGKGYPVGLKGDEINITARIFTIADVFDALTSKRLYKEAFSYEKSIEKLKSGAGTHFDPEILNTFLTISKEIYDKYKDKSIYELEQDVIFLLEEIFGLDAQGRYLKTPY